MNNKDLEDLKRLSLRWIIHKGFSLAEAEDLFQQSMLKALTTETHLEDQQKLKSWFMAILKNTLIDHIRKQKLHHEKEKIYQIEKELEQDDTELEKSFCKCVNHYIEELPKSEQAVIKDHFFEGKTFTNSSDRVKAMRARHKLKDMFSACCKVRKFKDLEDCGCE